MTSADHADMATGYLRDSRPEALTLAQIHATLAIAAALRDVREELVLTRDAIQRISEPGFRRVEV